MILFSGILTSFFCNGKTIELLYFSGVMYDDFEDS